MNKMFKVMALLLCASHGIFALEGELKVRGGVFIPTSDLFRCIYGKAGGHVELEGAITVYDCYQAWANIDWFSKKGHSVGLCNPTSIHIPSFSFGVKAPYDVSDCTRLYLGLGPNFSWVRVKNKSMFGCERCSKGAVGFVAKSGVDFMVSECTFIDVYLDYVYQPVKFQCRQNVSGVRIGVGLGRLF